LSLEIRIFCTTFAILVKVLKEMFKCDLIVKSIVLNIALRSYLIFLSFDIFVSTGNYFNPRIKLRAKMDDTMMELIIFNESKTIISIVLQLLLCGQ
jgi:hypothetical protein